MPSLRTRLRNKLVVLAFRAIFRPDEKRSDLERLGSAYGGWWVPARLIDHESVCYLGGVGNDITFDLAMIDRFGCHVWAMDPTPKAISWLREQHVPLKFQHLPVGMSGEPGELEFFLPENPLHISASVKNLQRTEQHFTAPVQTIANLMRELGHTRLDVLKLDIEGAEHDTIRRMIADNIRPSVLLVEYDQPEPLVWAVATTKLLRDSGYRLVKLEHLNLTFVRTSPALA